MKIDPPVRLNENISITSIDKSSNTDEEFQHYVNHFRDGAGIDRALNNLLSHSDSYYSFIDEKDILHFEWDDAEVDDEVLAGKCNINFFCFYAKNKHLHIFFESKERIALSTMCDYCKKMNIIDFSKTTEEILDILKFIYL